MLANQLTNPTFTPPEGVRLAPATRLCVDSLWTDKLRIEGIECLDDLTFEVTFASCRVLYCDQLTESEEIFFPTVKDEDIDSRTDEEWEDIHDYAKEALIDYSLSLLNHHGVPATAVIGTPHIRNDSYETSVLMTARVMVEPDQTCAVPDHLKEVLNIDERQKRITCDKVMAQLMLSDEEGDPSSLEEFGRQVGWAFPWHMHWGLSRAWIDVDCETPSEIAFEFDFSDATERHLGRKSIERRAFFIPVLRHAVRPIIQSASDEQNIKP